MNEPYSIRESAVGLHEMFVSFIDAGFTVEQAFELVRTVLLAGAGGSNQ